MEEAQCFSQTEALAFLTTRLPGLFLLEAFDLRSRQAYVRLCAEGSAPGFWPHLNALVAGEDLDPAACGILSFRPNPEESANLGVEVRLQEAAARRGGPGPRFSAMAHAMAAARARRAAARVARVWLELPAEAPAEAPAPALAVAEWDARGVCDLQRPSWVAHQCNCTSFRSAGLAAALFGLRPEADSYRRRSGPSAAGTVEVFPGPPGEAGILNLYSQFRPGPPGRAGAADSADCRLEWFRACLAELERLLAEGQLGPCEKGIAFPWRIGCVLGGGSWPAYRAELEAFAARVGVAVFLVRRPADA